MPTIKKSPSGANVDISSGGAGNCVTNAVKTPGLYACAENDGTIASGYGAFAEGNSAQAGPALLAFSIPAGGTLVTIVGNVVGQFGNGKPVRITPSAPAALSTVGGTIASAPVFAAGNTTFQITAPIDATTTAGTISECDLSILGRGRCAHAEGDRTIAIGAAGTHAEGSLTQSYGPGAHAEGGGAKAYGDECHAEGETTIAGGIDSHAEGGSTVAMGFCSHAEGGAGSTPGSVSSGRASHAEGAHSRCGSIVRTFTIAAGGLTVTIAGNVVGEFLLGSRIPFLPLTPIPGNTIMATIGTQPIFGGVNTTFDLIAPLAAAANFPTEAAAVTGGLTVDDIAFGFNGHSEGTETVALGFGSHAEGVFSQARGDRSHAEGNTTTASGLYSHSEGELTIASSRDSHAEGSASEANAIASHAEGTNCRAGNARRAFTIPAGGILVTIVGNVTTEFTNGQSVAIDITPPAGSVDIHRDATKTVASVPAFAAGNTTFNLSSAIDPYAVSGFIWMPNPGASSHAEGDTSTATGIKSHAEGDLTIASGLGAHSEGGGTTASNTYSHAEGGTTLASGQFSHAEGNGSQATNGSAHAEGQTTLASGFDSHAEGFATIASGAVSHAEGNTTTAAGANTHTQGFESKALRDNRHAEAGGKFAAIGDNQLERIQIRGSTPGVALGETTVLRSGAAIQNVLENLTSYAITVKCVARKMATGAAASQDVFFSIAFVASVNNAGAVTISAVTQVMAAILTGAAFVGATLVPTSGGPNDLTLTFSIAAGLTIACRVTASMEMVELLGT